MGELEDCSSAAVSIEKHDHQTEIPTDMIELEKDDEETKPARNAEKHIQHEFAVPALPAFAKPTTINKETVAQTEELINLKDNRNTVSIVNMTLIEDTDAKTDHNDIAQEKSVTLNNKSENSISNNLSITNGKIKHKKVEFPYHEPNWSGIPSEHNKYSLTVLKDGAVKNNIDISGKSLVTFGRLPEVCDVVIEHPSCSRYHAVLQYCTEEKDVRKIGYYLYDLSSTHGSYVNKEKVKAKVYVRVRVGYQIKFGGSSRLYIVEGPEEDQEEEIDMEEVRQMRLQNKQNMAAQQQGKCPSSQEGAQTDDGGATWGFGEDAEEEELDFQKLMENKKNIEVRDPKKTLNGFFEREGIDFEYEMCERGRGNSVIHVAQVRLPIESSFGVEVIAEGTSSNKKDAVLNCATDACKLIQAYDMMQNTCKEDQRLKRQRELEENDFYDSEDDNYLDRTGSVEKKRLKRKQWAGKVMEEGTETHESLKGKLEEKMKMLVAVEMKLKLSIAASEQVGDDDSLDAFMSSMQNKLDKKTESLIKRQIKELKTDIEGLKKLVEKTQPALPTFTMEKKTTSVTGDNLLPKYNVCSPKISANKSHSVDEVANSIEQKVETTVAVEKDPSSSKKKKRIYGVAMFPTQKKKCNEKSESEFIEWLPPKNQTGDGRTHLNDKLGY